MFFFFILPFLSFALSLSIRWTAERRRIVETKLDPRGNAKLPSPSAGPCLRSFCSFPAVICTSSPPLLVLLSHLKMRASGTCRYKNARLIMTMKIAKSRTWLEICFYFDPKECTVWLCISPWRNIWFLQRRNSFRNICLCISFRKGIRVETYDLVVSFLKRRIYEKINGLVRENSRINVVRYGCFVLHDEIYGQAISSSTNSRRNVHINNIFMS